MHRSEFHRCVDCVQRTRHNRIHRGWHVTVQEVAEVAPPLLERNGRVVEVLGVEPEELRAFYRVFVVKSKNMWEVQEKAEAAFRDREFDTLEEAMAAGIKWVDEQEDTCPTK